MGSDASTLPVPGALAPGAPTYRRAHPRRNWERASARGLGVIGGVALVLLVALSLALVVAAAERASFLSPPSHVSFPGWLAGPFKGLFPPLTKNHDKLKWAFSLGVAAMYLCYLLVLLCAPRLRARWVIAAVALLHVIFFISPPLSLTDVFNYLNYGRMGYVHHLNPYTTIPALEPHTDPAFAFSNWHHLLSPYGPLFTLYTYLLAPLGIATGFWMLKLSLAAASLGTLWLVWRSVPGPRTGAVWAAAGRGATARAGRGGQGWCPVATDPRGLPTCPRPGAMARPWVRRGPGKARLAPATGRPPRRSAARCRDLRGRRDRPGPRRGPAASTGDRAGWLGGGTT